MRSDRDPEASATTRRLLLLRRLVAAAHGSDLQVVTIPRPGWVAALTDAGFSPHIAQVLAGLYDADQRGLLIGRGDRTVTCTTPIDQTFAALAGAPA